MRTMLLAAALAVLAVPAWAADPGRIACENDVRDIVARIEANPRLAQQRVRELDDWVPVLLVQCRSNWGLAQANIRSIDTALGEDMPQTAASGYIEWADAARID